MLSRVLYGDRLDFEQKNGYTQFFLNGGFVCDTPSSGSIEWDIGRLINMGYSE